MNIRYYIGSSYRRKLLDIFQTKYAHLYQGKVIDIGGRDRGQFKKPRDKVDKWVFADIEPSHKPDIIIDVTNMNSILDESYDIVNAMELFEHVSNVDQGFLECHRILKPNGSFLLSMPFLFPIHADPYDYQRWTDHKIKMELIKVGFEIESLEFMGGYYTVLADLIKRFILNLPRPFRYFGYFSLPVLDFFLWAMEDSSKLSKQKIKGFTTGFFVVAKKKNKD